MVLLGSRTVFWFNFIAQNYTIFQTQSHLSFKAIPPLIFTPLLGSKNHERIASKNQQQNTGCLPIRSKRATCILPSVKIGVRGNSFPRKIACGGHQTEG